MKLTVYIDYMLDIVMLNVFQDNASKQPNIN